MDKEKKKKEVKGMEETEDLIYELTEAEKTEEKNPEAEGAENEDPSEEASEKNETEETKKKIEETEHEGKADEETEPEKNEERKEREEKEPPIDEAAETIRGMIESLGAEKVLALIIGNRNAAIEQIVEEMQAQADEMPMRSGPSADGRYRSIFELASYA